MPIWGWLIIVAVVGVAAWIVAWSTGRRSSSRQYLDTVEIANSQEKAMREQLAAEMVAREKVEKEKRELAAKLRAVNFWYEKQQAKLEKDATDAYRRLVGDPRALDDRLTELLSRAGKGPTK